MAEKRGKQSKASSKKAPDKAPPKPKASRLDLLRKKLELEQELLEKGGSERQKELEKVEKEYESTETVMDRAIEAEPSLKESIAHVEHKDVAEKVKDLVEQASQQQAVPEEAQSFVLSPTQKKNLQKAVLAYCALFGKVKAEVGKLIVGQEEAVKGMFRALIADGHVLVEGVPGVAKTTLIRALAKTTQCSFSRIQFTPDLLPTDIIGISTYQEGRGFYTLKGPIFNNFILADEINRAPPKVQSALLESMAEKQATIAKESFPVPLPFFTMATQNPLENVGTYSLPEAQIDRFLFKIYMGYPTIDEEERILKSNLSERGFDKYDIKPILNPDLILDIQALAKQIYVDKKVEKYIVKIIDATRSPKKYGVSLGKYVEFGASPRGSIGLFNAAKSEALLLGQTYVTPHHVKTIAHDVLRHRLILSYEGQAEGIKTEQVIDEILKKIPVP